MHIPKTAGNAIQNVLRQYSDDEIICTAPHHDGVERFELNNIYGLNKHSSAMDYYLTLGEVEFKNRFKFACIRNPWERAISYYFSPHRGQQVWSRENFIVFLSQIESMHTYLSSPHEMDFIMRYETLNLDFEKVCNHINIPKQMLPVRNKSYSKPYQEYYDKELVSIVAERFKKDIAFYGYTF